MKELQKNETNLKGLYGNIERNNRTYDRPKNLAKPITYYNGYNRKSYDYYNFNTISIDLLNSMEIYNDNSIDHTIVTIFNDAIRFYLLSLLDKVQSRLKDVISSVFDNRNSSNNGMIIYDAFAKAKANTIMYISNNYDAFGYYDLIAEMLAIDCIEDIEFMCNKYAIIINNTIYSIINKHLYVSLSELELSTVAYSAIDNLVNSEIINNISGLSKLLFDFIIKYKLEESLDSEIEF